MTSLTDHLYTTLGMSMPGETARIEIEAILLEAWTASADRWPDVVLSRDVFVAYLAERLLLRTDVAAELRGLATSALYLACACSLGVPEAIAAFERECLAPLDGVLERMGLGHEARDEVKQTLRIRYFLSKDDARPRIVGYAGRGDLRRWVRAAAVRTGLKLRGARSPEFADDDVLAAVADVQQDFELDFLKRTYRDTFDRAIRESYAALSPRDRNLLRYYFAKKLSIDQLGVLYHVHRATAARRLHKANEELVMGARDRLAVQLGVNRSEAWSILRLVQSQYKRTLLSVLAPA